MSSTKRAAGSTAEPTAKPKRLRPSFAAVIKVLVGPEDGIQETMIVYEDVIKDRSAFFKAACSKEWTPKAPEGHEKEKVIPLPTYEPDTFRLYLQYIHDPEADLFELLGLNEKLAYTNIEDIKKDLIENLTSACKEICKLWILSDFLGDSVVCDMVIDFLVSKGNKTMLIWWDTSTLEIVAEQTSVDSKLQQLYSDYVAAHVSEKWYQHLHSKLPSDFMIPIVNKLISYRNGRPTPDLSKYHSDNVKCIPDSDSTVE